MQKNTLLEGRTKLLFNNTEHKAKKSPYRLVEIPNGKIL